MCENSPFYCIWYRPLCTGLPRILDNVNKTYTLFDDGGKVCLYASFDMTFLIIYATESGNETDVKVSGYVYIVYAVERVEG